MKRCVKYAVFLLILPIVLILTGCQEYFYLRFKFDGSYMSDKTIDLLIPLSKDDPNYREYAIDSDIPQELRYPENSEIVNYNIDGYRSLRAHYIDALHFSRYTDTVSDGDVRNQIIKRVNMSIRLIDRACYNQLCREHKTFKIAVLNQNGDILQVSKEMPFVNEHGWYLDNEISYDVEHNTIAEKYTTENDNFEVWCLILLFTAIAMVFASIVVMLVFLLTEEKYDRARYRTYIVLFTMFSVPSVVLAVLWGIYSKFSTLTPQGALNRFFLIENNYYWFIFALLIPIFCTIIITALTRVIKREPQNINPPS